MHTHMKGKAMNRLLDIKEEQIIICGIGTNAKILSSIYRKNGIKVIAYLISDDQDSPCSEYEGIPIYKMGECGGEMKGNVVVSSVRESFSSKVMKELMQYNFKNVITAKDYKDWVEVLEYFYRFYFESKNIALDQPMINIAGARLINGFLLDTEGRYSFLVELGDIILPCFWGDYSICNEGPYELEEIGVTVKKDDIVFDCGANMGLFSALAIHKGGTAYSFEPTPDTRKYLETYKDVYDEKIKIYPYALSDKEGETDFYVGSDMNGENSINNLSGTCKNCITVPMKTVDGFVKEHGIKKVDFIKADIEGAERYMLLGAKETLNKFAPKLAICTYHLNDDPEVLEKIIMDANPEYKIIHRHKKLYAYIEK